jgi:hypothetical protein
MKSAGFDTHVFYEIFEQGKFSSGVVITFQVMAVARVSAGNPDAVCTLSESCQKKLGIHPASAGHPDCPDVGGILQSAHTGKICGAVGAPVAEKGNYFGLPVLLSWFRHILDLSRRALLIKQFPNCLLNPNIEYRNPKQIRNCPPDSPPCGRGPGFVLRI